MEQKNKKRKQGCLPPSEDDSIFRMLVYYSRDVRGKKIPPADDNPYKYYPSWDYEYERKETERKGKTPYQYEGCKRLLQFAYKLCHEDRVKKVIMLANKYRHLPLEQCRLFQMDQDAVMDYVEENYPEFVQEYLNSLKKAPPKF